MRTIRELLGNVAHPLSGEATVKHVGHGGLGPGNNEVAGEEGELGESGVAAVDTGGEDVESRHRDPFLGFGFPAGAPLP